MNPPSARTCSSRSIPAADNRHRGCSRNVRVSGEMRLPQVRLRPASVEQGSGQAIRQNTASVDRRSAARCRFMPCLTANCRARRSRPANESPTNDQEARPPSPAIGPLTCYFVEGGQDLNLRPLGYEDSATLFNLVRRQNRWVTQTSHTFVIAAHSRRAHL